MPAGGGSAPRRQALALLVRVETTEAYTDRVLDAALSEMALSPSDRALCTELTYGTLRHKVFLDAELDALLGKPISTLPLPIRATLRLGAYQLLMLRVPAYSAVDESVKLVGKKYGALKGVVNGVLRALARKHGLAEGTQKSRTQAFVTAEAATRAHPPWLQEHITQALGADEAQALMVANLSTPKIAVRVNTTRTTPQDLQNLLAQHGIEATPSPLCAESLVLPPSGKVTGLPGFAEGLMAVQDTAATLVGHLMRPQPGSTVIDLCAAPGGKATHAACLMHNTGHIIACDIHPGRLRLIERNALRLGHGNILPIEADITTDIGRHALQQALVGLPPVDHVILDAPCSALGTLRRHPEIFRKDGTHIAQLADMQRQLLDAATHFVPEGCTLIYAVCTFTQEEGPKQVESFLQRHQDFSLAAPDPALKDVTCNGFLQTWAHRHGLDGFFAARLVRRAA